MRSVAVVVTMLFIVALGFWTYRESYSTQAQLNRMAAVRRDIANLREELGVLRAEWAYLNRPKRLAELVDLNFEQLPLLPFASDQFVDLRAVAFPEAEEAGASGGGARPPQKPDVSPVEKR